MAATVALVALGPRLGTAMYFLCLAVASLAYLFILAAPKLQGSEGRRAFLVALAFAVLLRVPLLFGTIGFGSDMFRYQWDGRVQTLGFNPYGYVPADPALAFAHRDDTTRLMNSRSIYTTYPPAAQLFFRAVVSIGDSVYVMRAALIVCDVITIFLVWRLLLAIGMSEWLTLAYAWNPLVIYEAGFSGHIDVLCALWICACALLMAKRRPSLAAAAFALAVASKLLPIVLLPLFWRRIRLRDALVGGGVLALLYLPFVFSSNPLAPMNLVVDAVRFNGPIFQVVRALTTARLGAAAAVLVGLAVAAWCRVRLRIENPAAWSWPMASALVFGPVIYPWYLLSLTPFLLASATAPLIAWTLIIPAVYVVWERAIGGAPWVVPTYILVLEYGVVILAVAAQAFRPAVLRGDPSNL